MTECDLEVEDLNAVDVVQEGGGSKRWSTSCRRRCEIGICLGMEDVQHESRRPLASVSAIAREGTHRRVRTARVVHIENTRPGKRIPMSRRKGRVCGAAGTHERGRERRTCEVR